MFYFEVLCIKLCLVHAGQVLYQGAAPHPCPFFKEMSSIPHSFYSRRYAHICIIGLSLFFPFSNCFEVRMCCLDHDSYVRELKSLALGTRQSQGLFPYIAAETFFAHSGLRRYYSKFIPEFFPFQKQ